MSVRLITSHLVDEDTVKGVIADMERGVAFRVKGYNYRHNHQKENTPFIQVECKGIDWVAEGPFKRYTAADVEQQSFFPFAVARSSNNII